MKNELLDHIKNYMRGSKQVYDLFMLTHTHTHTHTHMHTPTHVHTHTHTFWRKGGGTHWGPMYYTFVTDPTVVEKKTQKNLPLENPVKVPAVPEIG